MNQRNLQLPTDDCPFFEDELATLLEIDVRFFHIARKAGFSGRDERIELNDFWLWFSFNVDAFRRGAGMRKFTGPRAARTAEEAGARFLATLITLHEFFGVLRSDKVVESASQTLHCTLLKNPSRTRKKSRKGIETVDLDPRTLGMNVEG